MLALYELTRLMQLFGLVQAKDATTHALKRSLSEDQGGIGLPHPTLILPQQLRYKGVEASHNLLLSAIHDVAVRSERFGEREHGL